MLLKTDELHVQHRNGIVFIPSYQNGKFLNSFLDTFMSTSLDNLMREFILLRNHYAGTHTFIVELSAKVMENYMLTPDDRVVMTARLKGSPWSDGSQRGIHLTTVDYHWINSPETGARRYQDGLGEHFYMILRFQDDPDFYRDELTEDLYLFKCFEKLVDEAIDTVVFGRERYFLLHVPLLVHIQFIKALREKINHHNERVCRLKPTRAKVAYTLEHHENGMNPAELGSIMVSITRADAVL